MMVGTLLVSSLAACGDDALSCPSGTVLAEGACVPLLDGGSDAAATDSGSDVAGDAAPDVLVDATPPTVQSTSPDTDEAAVELTSAIAVTFSENIEASTVTTTSFLVTDALGPVEGAVAVEGSTATFTPAAPFGLRRNIDVQLTTAVADLAGNTLTLPYDFSFTSRDGELGVSAPLETRVGDAEDLSLVVLPSGRAFATWSKRRSADVDAWSARFDPDGSWGAPALIESQTTPPTLLRTAGSDEGRSRFGAEDATSGPIGPMPPACGAPKSNWEIRLSPFHT